MSTGNETQPAKSNGPAPSLAQLGSNASSHCALCDGRDPRNPPDRWGGLLKEPRFNWLCPQCAGEVLNQIDEYEEEFERQRRIFQFLAASASTGRENPEEIPNAEATTTPGGYVLTDGPPWTKPDRNPWWKRAWQSLFSSRQRGSLEAARSEVEAHPSPEPSGLKSGGAAE